MSSNRSQATLVFKLSQLQVLAWSATLLLSILLDALFREITGSVPEWLYGIKLSLIAFFLLLSLFWKPAKDLQRYLLIFLAIFLTERTWQAVAESPQWQSWFLPFGIGFLFQLFSIQIGRLAVAIASSHLSTSLELGEKKLSWDLAI